jgi:hypothetical protein
VAKAWHDAADRCASPPEQESCSESRGSGSYSYDYETTEDEEDYLVLRCHGGLVVMRFRSPPQFVWACIGPCISSSHIAGHLGCVGIGELSLKIAQYSSSNSQINNNNEEINNANT